jgi:hypothetical protein
VRFMRATGLCLPAAGRLRLMEEADVTYGRVEMESGGRAGHSDAGNEPVTGGQLAACHVWATSIGLLVLFRQAWMRPCLENRASCGCRRKSRRLAVPGARAPDLIGVATSRSRTWSSHWVSGCSNDTARRSSLLRPLSRKPSLMRYRGQLANDQPIVSAASTPALGHVARALVRDPQTQDQSVHSWS